MSIAQRIPPPAVSLGAAIGLAVSAYSGKALVLLIGAGITWLVLIQPPWCLYLLVAILPVAIDFGGGVTVTRVVAPLVLALVVLHALTRRGPALPNPFEWPAGVIGLLFFVSVLLSIGIAPDRTKAFPELGPFALYFALFYTTLAYVRVPTNLEPLLKILLTVGVVQALIALLQVEFRFVLPGDWRPAVMQKIDLTDRGFRAEGTTSHPIFLAGFMQMIMPFMAYQVTRARNARTRLLLSGALVLCVYAWFNAYSRSSMIGVAAMLIAALAVSCRAGGLFAGAAVAGSALVLALHEFSVYALIRSIEQIGFFGDAFRYANLYASIDSFRFRIESVAGGFYLFMAHPWRGVGLGQTIDVYEPYLPSWATSPVHPTEIHNAFLEVAAEFGIVGFFSFVALWMFAFRSLAQAWRDPPLGAYARVLFIVLVGQFFFLMFTPMIRDIWFTLPLAMAIGRMAHSPNGEERVWP